MLQVKDQQEAERKKVASQEIQQALDEQTKVIAAKQANVREDLAGVEPAVIEAKQGTVTGQEIKQGQWARFEQQRMYHRRNIF